MINAVATGSRASAARERVIVTETPSALAPWCVAATTAPGALETETTAAQSQQRPLAMKTPESRAGLWEPRPCRMISRSARHTANRPTRPPLTSLTRSLGGQFNGHSEDVPEPVPNHI